MQDFGVGKEGQLHGGEIGGKVRRLMKKVRACVNEEGIDIGL